MRRDLLFEGANELHYEIRSIVEKAKLFEELGVQITWENIGDPVAKGETIPAWIKEKVKNAYDADIAYAYSPTNGLDKTREFIAEKTNSRGKARITKDDVIFFNGLGDAISKVYQILSSSVRVLGPSPAYSTHSSAEAAHAASESLTYNLDPHNKWYPDINDIRNKVKYNKLISGILVINPNNPTGAVYPESYIRQIVEIAKEFDLFLIFDEIYMNISFNDEKFVPLSDVIGDVCGISMKGISKEWPWPGSRCGWIEVYNAGKNSTFRKYIESIVNKKMLEVCATTHPQIVIPEVLSDLRYEEHHKKRNIKFNERAAKAYNLLKGTKGIIAHKAEGAFYMTVMFEEGVLNNRQKLKIANPSVNALVDKITQNVAFDTRFVYNLLGAIGICVVPLTSFECKHNGFRITLLETDDKKFEWIFRTVKEKIDEYLNS